MKLLFQFSVRFASSSSAILVFPTVDGQISFSASCLQRFHICGRDGGRTRLVPHSLVSACCTLSYILDKLVRSRRNCRWNQLTGLNVHVVQLPWSTEGGGLLNTQLLCYKLNLGKEKTKNS